MELMQLTEVRAGFIAILVLDFKGDFVDVPGRLGRDVWDHYSATDGLRLGCGPPLICAGHVGWVNNFTKIIAAHCDLKYSESTLAATMRIGLTLLNQPQAATVIWPSLLLIEQLLTILPGDLIARKTEYKRTVQQKIEYLRRISEGLFSAEQGFDIFEHLIKPRRCAVIDCTMLSPLLSQILVNLLALQFLFVRITLRQVSERPVFLLLIDESDPVCSRKASTVYPEGYSYLGQYLKQARQFGGTAALGVNFLGDCSRYISSNASYHVILNQSEPESATEAASTLLEPSSRQLVSSLKTGQAVFKETMGPVSHGMLMQADHVPASDLPRPEKFDTHEYTPARTIDEIPGLSSHLGQFISAHKATIKRQSSKTATKPTMNKTQRAFLDHMSLNEYKPLRVVLSHMPELSTGSGHKIIKALSRQGYIKATTKRTGRSWERFGSITEKGWKYLNKTPRRRKLRGDDVHTTLCYGKCDLDLKNGFEESFCEGQLQGSTGFNDVISRKGERAYVTEVIVGCDANIAKHARDCFINSTEQVEKLTIVTLLKSQHAKIREAVMSDPELVFFIDRIEFITAEKILKELYGNESG